MADTPNPQAGKTLEMRVAELEDKLAQTQITEADIKAYHKVASALAAKAGSPPAGGGTAAAPCIANQAATPALSPQVCIINHCVISHCVISHCVHCIITPCIIHPIIVNDCTCGPCLQAATTPAPAVQKEFEDLGS